MNVIINICNMIMSACADKTPSSNINQLMGKKNMPNINYLL